MKSKAAVRRIVEALKTLYPDALCSLQYQKDYELLFAVRLSAQCTDARVNMVTPALYARFPTLEAFANAGYEEVGEAIKSCGFYNTKSKDLVECAKILLEKYSADHKEYRVHDKIGFLGIPQRGCHCLHDARRQLRVHPLSRRGRRGSL